MNQSSNKPDISNIIKRSKERITKCIRCCTCCTKGGPALHKADKPLIDQGKLHGRFLFTIRKGEPAEDNIKGGLVFADSDIIKIKSKDNSTACLYVDMNNTSCHIYDHRPLECYTLKCWDTKEIERIYNKDRLTRKDILGHIDGLWEIVQEHQEKCSYEKVKVILDNHPEKLDREPLKEILEMIRYDKTIRRMMVEKPDLDANMADFLFGWPLQKTLRKFGLEFGPA